MGIEMGFTAVTRPSREPRPGAAQDIGPGPRCSQLRQQPVRLGLPLAQGVSALAPGQVVCQKMNLSHEGNLLVPGDPPAQFRIVRRAMPIGLEDGTAQRGELRQFPRFAQRDPAKLNQQITQVERRVPARVFVEVQDDQSARLPE